MKVFSPGLVTLAVAVAALSGCTVSLQPFYTKATLLDDRSIEGRWTDGETTWQITRTSPAHFEIATCEDKDDCQADTVGVLFRSSDVTFLDFQEKPQSSFSANVRPHGLFQIQTNNDDAVDLIMLDQDRLAKLVKDERLDTEFADIESGLLLTASPADLQSFVLRHLSDPQVFAESHHLWRPDPVTE